MFCTFKYLVFGDILGIAVVTFADLRTVCLHILQANMLKLFVIVLKAKSSN